MPIVTAQPIEISPTPISSKTTLSPVSWPANNPNVEIGLTLALADQTDPNLILTYAILTSYDGINYVGSNNTWQGNVLDTQGNQAQPVFRLSQWSAAQGFPSFVKLQITPSRPLTMQGSVSFG